MNPHTLDPSLAGTLLAASNVPIAPRWLVFPLAGFTLIVVLAHLAAVLRAPMPSSRRRIRLANSMVMLTLVPLMTCAFGIATPSGTRTFLMAWLGVVGLLGIMVLLAILDSANTARLHVQDRAALRARFREQFRRPRPAGPPQHEPPHDPA